MDAHEALQEVLNENQRLKQTNRNLRDKLGAYESVWEETQSVSARYGSRVHLRANVIAKALGTARNGTTPKHQPILKEAQHWLETRPERNQP